eukprot:1331653-Amorphochlora_amoeboformis.AAC.1
MGILLSKIVQQIFGNKEARVLILGLDNAGKTTILYKLYAPDQVYRTPQSCVSMYIQTHLSILPFSSCRIPWRKPAVTYIRRTTPTIGFNVEYVHYNKIKFAVWDLGGQTNIRPYWRCYYANTHAIIYVVDSADKERMATAKKELMSMLAEEELKDSVLLVFANKQDQKEAMKVTEVSKQLGLTSLKNRQWHIEKSSAIKNIGNSPSYPIHVLD